MSAWGTSLPSNDIYADIYYEFFELYNDGHSVEDITDKIINENQAIIDSFEDGHNVWFALAKAQWECKRLDKKILKKVTAVINNDENIKVWRELGASEGDLKKRRLVLDKFLHQLESERPKAKARRKKRTVIYEPGFKKGDCLTFKLDNGNYGGLIVLEAVSTTDHPYNVFLAATVIDQASEPTLQDFKKSMLLVGKLQDVSKDEKSGEYREVWKDKPEVCWCVSNEQNVVKQVARINVAPTYSPDGQQVGISFTGSIQKGVIPRINYLMNLKPSERANPIPLDPYLKESFMKKIRGIIQSAKG